MKTEKRLRLLVLHPPHSPSPSIFLTSSQNITREKSAPRKVADQGNAIINEDGATKSKNRERVWVWLSKEQSGAKGGTRIHILVSIIFPCHGHIESTVQFWSFDFMSHQHEVTAPQTQTTHQALYCTPSTLSRTIHLYSHLDTEPRWVFSTELCFSRINPASPSPLLFS